MKSSSRSFTPVSLVLLVLGLSVGGLTGWYAGFRSGNSHAPVKSAQADFRNSRTTRTDRENVDSDRSGKTGKTNVAANSKDFAKSVRAIFRENVKDRRIAMFDKMVESVSLDRFPDLVALIRENDLRGNDGGAEWDRIWMNWSKRDPAGALKFIDQFDWTGWTPIAPVNARKSTLSNWAEVDPQSVSKYVEDRKELLNRDRAMIQGLVEGWSNVDPVSAAEWLFKTGLGQNFEYEKVIQSMTRSGSQETVDDWFSKLDPTVVPPNDLKGLARAIAGQKQRYEPEKAAAWLQANLDQPWVEDSSGIFESTARAYAERNPREALQWAANTGADNATIQAMDTWCRNDLDGASKWLVENSDNPSFSVTASQVMAHLQRRDPAAARRWVESFENEKLREQLLNELGSR